MRVHSAALVLLVCLDAGAQSRVDPKITSIFPFGAQQGATFTALVRGTGIAAATAVVVEDAPISVTVVKAESEAPGQGTGRNKTPVDLVSLRVEVASGAKAGRYPIRLITRHGITNALPIHVVETPVKTEPDGAHDTEDAAVAVPSVPVIYAGRLAHRGEADYYKFQAEAGQTLTFETISGLPQIAAGGSAATIANFDPALSIYAAEGSWLDPKRTKRIAHNDEPVWVFGKPTDAHLVHRFDKAGTYWLRVEAFAGQGGMDYSYQLKIAPGAVPHDVPSPSASADWQERVWTRRLSSDRLKEVAARGAKQQEHKAIETYRGRPETAPIKLPANVDGAIATPGEAHRARFRVDSPADIVMEVETTAAAPPFFNPVVRLLSEAGTEVATNVFAGRGACSGAMTKSLQAKTVVPLRDPGEYTLEIRDATADLAGEDFQYRVQIRPQIPHVGQVRVEGDHLNLTPGEAKTIRVFFDREEDYRGAIAVTAESLPPGVSTAVAADYEPEKDDPPTPGKRERYTPKTERAVLAFTVAPDAVASSTPYVAHVVVRPLVDGRLGDVLATKSIYVMVTEKP